MEEKKENEEIKIYSLIAKYSNLLTKYKSAKGVTFPLTNIRGIVIHQCSENKDVTEIVDEMVAKKINPYHFIIDENGDIGQINEITECVAHARSKKYTSFANTFFGDSTCPIFEETPETPHGEASVDNCTISILIPYCSDGKLDSNVYESLQKLVAYIINKYSKSLQATSAVVSAFEISEGFDDPKCFKDDPDFYLRFKYDVEKLRSKWLLHYEGFKRGYPTEKILPVD